MRFVTGLSKDYSSIPLNLLKWKSRRGLLENDLILERFYSKYKDKLSPDDKNGLQLLLGLNDNDLLDLFLHRTELYGSLNLPHVKNVLKKIREI